MLDFLNACQSALPWPEIAVSSAVGFLSGFVTGLIYHRPPKEHL
jgi:hypothetical protein